MDNDAEKNYQENVAYLLNLARNLLGDTMKAYYEGDPINIPTINLPCIIAEKTSTHFSVENAPTGNDAVTEQISLRVVFNKLDDTNPDQNVMDTYDLSERKLRKLVEGRNPTTGQLSSDSLMYALRTDLMLGNTIRNQDVEVSYGIVPRTTDLLTSEAQILITIDEIIQVVR